MYVYKTPMVDSNLISCNCVKQLPYYVTKAHTQYYSANSFDYILDSSIVYIISI